MSEALARERLAAEELGTAVEQVGRHDLADALEKIARKLPVATGVETAVMRVRDSDANGVLHLVASEGVPASHRRNALFFTQSIAQARSMFVLKSRHSLARALGFTWLDGEWIKDAGEPLGTITVGTRTERRPTTAHLALLKEVAERLGRKLRHVDRRTGTLEATSHEVARASLTVPVEAPARVANQLRPRELTVLALYSEGLSALEIADVFVISPHTVRTHIKNAYRRLGVHSREEAARLIHAERVHELV
jgi:DNA-binding CsgD family transcriptional regulator